MRWLLFACILLASGLQAGSFEDCFKKAKHKRDTHSILGVDMIYVINEHKNLRQFKQIKKDFDDYGIVPYRFNAVDPKSMSYTMLSKVGVRMINTRSDFTALRLRKGLLKPSLKPSIMDDGEKTYFSNTMTMKKIARNLDFLSVIYDAYRSKKNCVWIMEDNVEICKDPLTLTTRLVELDKADPVWDVLYTDLDAKIEPGSKEDDSEIFYINRPDLTFGTIDTYVNRAQNLGNFQEIGLRTGAYSFLLSRHGMKLILDYYHKNHIFVPFAQEILLIPGIHPYGLPDPIVTNDRAL